MKKMDIRTRILRLRSDAVDFYFHSGLATDNSLQRHGFRSAILNIYRAEIVKMQTPKSLKEWMYLNPFVKPSYDL